MTKYDVIIIGGGVAGLSLGYALSPIKKVLILEQENSCFYHSSGRATANFSVNYGPQTIRNLTLASKKFFQYPPFDLVEHSLISEMGMLTVANLKQLDKLEKEFAFSKQFEPQIYELNKQQIQKFAPILKPEFYHSGYYDPSAYQLNLTELKNILVRYINRHNGCIQTSSQVMQLSYNKYWKVTTSNMEEYHSEILINAGGAWADEIAKIAGVSPLGLESYSRNVLQFNSQADKTYSWPLIRDIDMELYLKPYLDGGLIASPCDEALSIPCDVLVDEQQIKKCIYTVEYRTYLKIPNILKQWAGLRTFSPNKLPIVGFDPDNPAFFWFAALGGYGNKISPALTQIALALIMDKPLPDELSYYKLSADMFIPAKR